MLSETGTQFFGYYPGTVALVTAEHGGVRNVMAAGWHTALSAQPPLYGVLIGRERATHGLVTQSGTFGINFLPASLSKPIQGTGCCRCMTCHSRTNWPGWVWTPCPMRRWPWPTRTCITAAA